MSLCANLPVPPPSTTFPILSGVEKPLTSTQTILKLVEKPVQISIVLPHFRNLVDGVQHGGVVLAAELPPDLGQ